MGLGQLWRGPQSGGEGELQGGRNVLRGEGEFEGFRVTVQVRFLGEVGGSRWRGRQE